MAYNFENNPEFHVWDNGSFDQLNSNSAFLANSFFKFLEPDDFILDIGCGPGYNVKILSDNGYKVKGIDLNEELVRKALSANLDVEKLDALQAIHKYASQATVFLMSDFIEHIPLDVVVMILTAIGKIPGKRVFISTPNLDSIMGFKFWFHMPTHVNAMHPFVIRSMLAKMNYQIVREWSEYGNLPGRGFKLWIRKKILRALFGTQAELFIGGANICFVAKTRTA